MERVPLRKPKLYFDTMAHPSHVTFDDGVEERRNLSCMNSRIYAYRKCGSQLTPFWAEALDCQRDRVGFSRFTKMLRAPSNLKRFRAVFCVQASIRRVTFEALSIDEAQQLAATWGFGLEGEASAESEAETRSHVPSEALDVESACRVLGSISRTTLYRLLVKGQLERLPSTRKVLVTRRSIERYCSKAR